MDYLRTALAISLGLAASSVSAGYAQLSPPPGFTQNSAGFFYRAAANSGTILQNTVRTNAALNVGGRSVLVPAAMRLAANAPAFAARFVFVNPALAIGAAAGAIALAAWIKSANIEWDQELGAWVQPERTDIEPSTGKAYRVDFSQSSASFSTKEGACKGFMTEPQFMQYAGAGSTEITFMYVNSDGRCFYSGRASNGQVYSPLVGFGAPYPVPATCPVGWYETGAGCVQTLPKRVVTPEEFEQALAPKKLPDSVPQHLPIDLPVEKPVVNPSPFPDGTPTPFDVPQGNPTLVPNSNPQQWNTPAIRVTPAPTPENPLQVDLTPIDIKRPTPEPLPPIQPIKPKDPNEPNPEPEPTERTPDLCEKYPNIVACQKLGDVTATPVPDKQVTMAINKESGFGPENATCPAPRQAVLMGKTYSFSWQPMCDFATMIRPLLIAFAWLSAAFSFMGLARKES